MCMCMPPCLSVRKAGKERNGEEEEEKEEEVAGVRPVTILILREREEKWHGMAHASNIPIQWLCVYMYGEDGVW